MPKTRTGSPNLPSFCCSLGVCDPVDNYCAGSQTLLEHKECCPKLEVTVSICLPFNALWGSVTPVDNYYAGSQIRLEHKD